MTLAQQKRAFLVDSHLRQAQELLDRLQLEEARRELGRAYELDPENAEVKAKLAEVGALLGLPGDEWATVAEQLGNEYEIRIQQLKAEAGDTLRKGKLALGRRDYDAAIAELRLTLNHIRWAPYSIDWGGIDTEAEALLLQAETERGAAAEAERMEQQRAATEALREREQRENARRDAIVANILEQAIDAFEAEEYDKAVETRRRGAAQDPAQRPGRGAARRRLPRRPRQGPQRLHHREARRVRPVARAPAGARDPVDGRDHLPGPGRLARADGAPPPPPRARPVAEDQRLRGRAAPPAGHPDGRPAGHRGRGEPALGHRPHPHLHRPRTLIVDPAAENAVLDEGIVFDFNFDNELSVSQALNLITDMAGEEVTWTIRHDAVLVTTREKARGEPVIYNHDVQDLIMGLTDFTGPRIDRLRLLDELEDDDGGGPFGGILESPRLIEIEDLATLIQENVEVGSWEDDGVSIEPGEGFILIVHSASVQAKVKEFLEDLRRFNSSLVTIESKFMTVADNWIQEIGVDFRGLDSVNVSDVTNGLEDMASRGLDNGGTGNEGEGAAGSPSAGFFYDDGLDGDFRGTTQNYFESPLGDALSVIGGLTFQLTFLNDAQISMILRAVEKSSQFELVNSQMLSVHNTQRAYVTVINQRAYIQDFDVEVAQFQAVADPQVNVLHEGVVLDVRPTIHHDRQYLTLEIQPTVATVVALRDFSTTLGGNTSPVSFQLPVLEVQSVNTSALVPDGGSILLGGLSQVRNIERRAEVPWLARIPILGFLFKQEGYNDERRSLMIMIKARITDVRESVRQRLESGE